MYDTAAIVANFEYEKSGRAFIYEANKAINFLDEQAQNYVSQPPVRKIFQEVKKQLEEFFHYFNRIIRFGDDNPGLVRSSVDRMVENLFLARKATDTMGLENNAPGYTDAKGLLEVFDFLNDFAQRNFNEHYSKRSFDIPETFNYDLKENEFGHQLSARAHEMEAAHRYNFLTALEDFLELDSLDANHKFHIRDMLENAQLRLSGNYNNPLFKERQQANEIYQNKLYSYEKELRPRALNIMNRFIQVEAELEPSLRKARIINGLNSGSKSSLLANLVKYTDLPKEEIVANLVLIMEAAIDETKAREAHKAYENLSSKLIIKARSDKSIRLSYLAKTALTLYSLKQVADGWSVDHTRKAKALFDEKAIKNGEAKSLLNSAHFYSLDKLLDSKRDLFTSTGDENRYKEHLELALEVIEEPVQDHLAEFRTKGAAYTKHFYNEFKKLIHLSGVSRRKFKEAVNDHFFRQKEKNTLVRILRAAYRETQNRNVIHPKDAAIFIKTLTDLILEKEGRSFVQGLKLSL